MIPTVQPDDVINAWRNDERTTAVYAFKLQEALASNQLSAFCDEQADEAITADQRLIWAFLSARSLNCSRTAYLNLLKHMLPVINEDENVHSIRKEMDACAAFSVDSDEEDEHLSTGIIMPTPLILKGLTEDESSSAAMRLAALMAAGMWSELLASWDLLDWKRLFSLILTRAPPSKIRGICGELARRLIAAGNIVSAALPAVVAGDVEAMMTATEKYGCEERVALGAILRQSIGGGSSRTVSAGERYQNVLVNFTKQLMEEGEFSLATEFLKVIPANDCIKDLHQLRNVLHNGLNQAVVGIRNQTSVNGLHSAASLKNAFLVSSIAVGTSDLEGISSNGSSGNMLTSASSFSCNPPSVTKSPLMYSNPSTTSSFSTFVTSYQQQQYFPSMQTQMVTEYHNGLVTSHLNRMPATQFPAPKFLATPFIHQSTAHDMAKSDWNDPPAVRAKRNKSHTVVADISWKPYCPEKNSDGSQEAMSLVPQQPRHVTNTDALCDADKRMIEILRHAVYNIRQKTDDLVTSRKLDTVERKITKELIPRLARAKFSQTTLLRLYEIADRLIAGDFRGCNMVVGGLARGADFTELSAILPFLKTLISCAQYCGL